MELFLLIKLFLYWVPFSILFLLMMDFYSNFILVQIEIILFMLKSEKNSHSHIYSINRNDSQMHHLFLLGIIKKKFVYHNYYYL